MFLIEKNNRIRLTKGDTATMLVEAYDLDKKKYTFAADDKIVLTVRKTVNAPISFQKEVDETHHIIIESTDTAELAAGLYMYDVQLTTKEGFVYTIIPPTFFELTAEVSY